MSDFLVNLARRSAGLAPEVRARSTPVFIAADASEASATTAVERSEKSSVRTDVPPLLAHTASADIPRSPAPAPPPSPIGPVTPLVGVAQRSPALNEPAAITPAKSLVQPAERPIAHASPHAEVGVSSQASAIAVDATARVDSRHEPNEESRTQVVREEIRIVDSAIEPVIARNDNDPANPVIVSILPAERANPANSPVQVIAAEERIVNVRIGAIEIVGPENPTQTPAAVSAGAPSSSGNGFALGGFDEYAALRRYTPWAW